MKKYIVGFLLISGMIIYQVSPAAANDSTLLGFSPTEKTVSDFLGDGYEIKGANPGLGMILILQKGASAALCFIDRSQHQCLEALDRAAARETVKAAQERSKAAKPNGLYERGPAQSW